ncbi:MAG: glycosyltransferase [Candidatus Moraniibacteriota bacterium]
MEKSQEPKKKIAFVHDFLVSYGGAERVLESLVKLDPDAPIYVLLADERIVRERFAGHEIRTSFLQKLPKFFRKRYRLLLPFFAVAAESMDFRDFDVVISSSGAWSKGIVTRLKTTHIAYLHSPMRFLWDANEGYFDAVGLGGYRRFFGRILLSYLRVWDREAAERPDILISNSAFTHARVLKYYRRDSGIVIPPVTLMDDSHPSSSKTRELPSERGAGEREDFFLVVARLTESKGVGAAIDAFDKLGLPLRIVGEGRERKKLQRRTGPSVRLEGAVDDKTLVSLYRRARAVIVPSEEDFGLAAAEALSFGTPVITLGRGGSLEVVEEGISGEFFREATAEVIAATVRRFIERGNDAYVIDREAIRKRYSEERFLSEWKEQIERAGTDIERI